MIRFIRSLHFDQVSLNCQFLSLFLDNFPYLIYEGLEKNGLNKSHRPRLIKGGWPSLVSPLLVLRPYIAALVFKEFICKV